MGKKKVRKELKQLRAELRSLQRDLARTRAELAARPVAPAEVAAVVPIAHGPGPVEVETACAPKALLPKTECCGSKERCTRCPIMMLKQGTLPAGMTVKHRKLVGPDGKKISKKALRTVA